jgi:hypothetical protein
MTPRGIAISEAIFFSMAISITDQIRTACHAVADRAHYVRVDAARLAEYATELPLERIVAPDLDATRHYLGHGDDTLAFLITLDAVNFGSGYFPHLRKRPGMSGYFTVASSLNDRFRRQGPFSAQQLAAITVDDCRAIFNQDRGNAPVLELMGLFAQAWNDLGQYLLDRFRGRFTELVEAADRSAIQLISLLDRIPFFHDVEKYAELDVPFYKRAQLISADLALAFSGQGPGRFDDLEQLTIFADNLVPHVLRVDRVLLYDPSLAERIDREELIAAGSPEEVEIRACAVHAVERIVTELRSAGNAVTAPQLDYLLWNRGQQPYYKQVRPRHRARSVYY